MPPESATLVSMAPVGFELANLGDLTRQCEAGIPMACRRVAEIHSKGPRQDLASALAYYTKACGMSDGLSCAWSGYLTEFGDVDPKPGAIKRSSAAIAAAEVFYLKGCHLRNGWACNRSGTIFRVGLGRDVDFDKAEHYLHLGCELGSLMACSELGRLVRSKEHAARLYREACDGGLLDGCIKLGEAYQRGEGVPRHLIRAAKLFRFSCDSGSLQGCTKLAEAYALGLGVPQESALSRVLIERSRAAGDPSATTLLGWCHLAGRCDCQADVKRAAALFNEALSLHDHLAAYYLGQMYESGVHFEKDLDRARAMYTIACKAGHERSCEYKLRLAKTAHQDVR